MKLFLDDERFGPKGWTTVRPSYFFWTYLTKRDEIEAISLNNDMGDEYMSGEKVLQCIEALYYRDGILPPLLYVHSQNVVERKNMIQAINRLNEFVGAKYNTTTRNYDPTILPEGENMVN
jgi:hypothetical protein